MGDSPAAILYDASGNPVYPEPVAPYVSKQAGQAYCVTINGGDPVDLDTAGGPLVALNNDSASLLLVVDRVLAYAAGSVSGWLTKNATIGTLGNHAAQTPVNLHFGSANTAAATANGWDGSSGSAMTGISGGTKAVPIFHPAAGFFEVKIPELVLLEDDNLIIEAKAISTTIDYQLAVIFYFTAALS